MKYLVTGGAGLTSLHICEELMICRNDVVILNNFSTRKIANLFKIQNNPKFKQVQRTVAEKLQRIISEKPKNTFEFILQTSMRTTR